MLTKCVFAASVFLSLTSFACNGLAQCIVIESLSCQPTNESLCADNYGTVSCVFDGTTIKCKVPKESRPKSGTYYGFRDADPAEVGNTGWSISGNVFCEESRDCHPDCTFAIIEETLVNRCQSTTAAWSNSGTNFHTLSGSGFCIGGE